VKSSGVHRVFDWRGFRDLTTPYGSPRRRDPSGWWSCGRKARYGTEAAALTEARRLNREQPLNGRRTMAYPCERCGGWHVGGVDMRHEFAAAREFVALVDVLGDRAVGCLVEENWRHQERRTRAIRQRAEAAKKHARRRLGG
jgi:hypothetical protein